MQPQPPTRQQELIAFAAAVKVEIDTALNAYLSQKLLTPNQAAMVARDAYSILSSPSKEVLLQELQRLGTRHTVMQEVYTHVSKGWFVQPPQVHTAPLPQQPRGATTTPLSQPSAPVPPKDAVILGKHAKTGAFIYLSQEDRRRGLYVIGKNGTGKTTFLVNLMLQDIQAGMGLCFLDPHGDAIQDILRRLPAEREKDVILLDVLDTKYPFGLNLYECADPTDLELAARSCEQVMHVFEKVWGADSKTPSWAPAMEDLLRNTALTFIQKQDLTLAEMPIVLTDETAREKITSNLKSTQLRLFWQQFGKRKDKNEYMASTLNKVRAFLSNPIVEHIVGQSHTTIDFRKIMDEGKILLVTLPGRYEDITSLLGAVIIGQLLNAALSRVNIPEEKRRQFNLYADEYQRFATPDFATLLSEARKFRLATTIAHQFRDQLDQANRGATLNAANMVVFRISGEDGEELAKEFDSTPPPPEVIGQKPVLTPKREVIDHLLKNGHSNPNYAALTHKYLVGFDMICKMEFDRPHMAGATNSITANILLGMRNRQAMKQYSNEVNLLQDLQVAMQKLNNFLYEVMRDRSGNKPLPQSMFITFAQVLAEAPETNFFDLIKPVSRWQREIFLLCEPHMDAAMEAKKTLIPRPNSYHVKLFDNCMQFIISLRQLVDILAHEPILVDSGQHEPILDKPRTYADVQNQIATDVTNLSQYSARCKLGHIEVTMKTLPLAAGLSDDLLEKRKGTIRDTTRNMYCKPRLEVEEEIATRQATLIELEEKKRRTKGEETI